LKSERALAVENIVKLLAERIQAPPTRQAQIIEELRDGKGVAYTLALANVIPSLNGEAKQNASEALVQRLARMTPADFRDKLYDPNPEVRRAAALACARKDEFSRGGDTVRTFRCRHPRLGSWAAMAF
jgi:hypothetical protein